MDSGGSTLTEGQQRRLIATFQHLYQILEDIERSFEEARGSSPFNRYRADIGTAEERRLRDTAAQVSLHLAGILSRLELAPAPQIISQRHSVLTALTFFDIAVRELEPDYMIAYGALTPEGAAALTSIARELHRAVGQLRATL